MTTPRSSCPVTPRHHDPRIRFVNHPTNLREVGNMNALLREATGRYFTWLFDDDLYEPGFLKAAYDAPWKAPGTPLPCSPPSR